MGTEARSKDMHSDSPGPGQYELKKSQEGPQWAMGTSKRAEIRGSDAPGPGGYSPKHGPEGPAYSMQGRVLSKERLDVPGPGQYEMRQT